MKKDTLLFCFIVLGFFVSCSDNKTIILQKKIVDCHYNSGFVHMHQLAKNIFETKRKIILESYGNIPYEKISECFLTLQVPLTKMFVVMNDTLMENSYLVDGCKVSRMPYNVFLKENIYNKMKFISVYNPSENDSINNQLNKIIDYNFLNKNPYFSERYLTGNTLDNICSDLVIVQLEILSLIECR